MDSTTSSPNNVPGIDRDPRDLDDAEVSRRLRRLKNLASLMDTAIRIPGTSIRFGADAILGLIPFVGDASGALVGMVIVNEARRLGVPNHKMARMLVNIGLDAALGSVPLLGDVFDIYFKSHQRNVQLILDHFDADEMAPNKR